MRTALVLLALMFAACETRERTGALAARELRADGPAGATVVTGGELVLVDTAGRKLVLAPSGFRFLDPRGREVASLALDATTGAPRLVLRDAAGEAVTVALPAP